MATTSGDCYGWTDLLDFKGREGNFMEGQCNFFGAEPILPQAVGWVIVVCFGALFTMLTSTMLFLDGRFGGSSHTSEHFTTAGRSVKAGLTACDTVSKWTWAATLLQSSNVAYRFGVSGPFWYAAGATVQVILFAVLAVEVKRKAPTCHTVLEIVRARWGTVGHLTFLVFCLLTNIIVTSMLILGGAAVTNGLTGMNIYAAAILLPVGVMVFVAHGGLRAAYLNAYSHVAVLYIAILIFVFMIYASGIYPIGSISKVYDNLQVLGGFKPVKDNKGGSYLTMWSLEGLVFGIINVIGNFGTVFVDQAYWQGAIGALPSATYRGYLIGGMCWFAIPFTMATAMGLGARAMNLPISLTESSAGLVPPAVAVQLLGAGGGFLLILQLWMAVTAAANAEQIAVATLVSYDVYRTYVNKKATGRQIIFVTRIAVLCYGVLSGIFAIILLKIGLNLGWVYLFMGIVIGSAVIPIAFSITWAKCSTAGAVGGAITGLVGAVITWVCTAKGLTGSITIATLGGDFPMLAGNVVAICLSGIVCVIISLIKPQNYDWVQMMDIPTLEADPLAHMSGETADALTKALKWTWITGGGLTLTVLILWPILALPAGVFSKGYFTMWVVIAMIWVVIAAATCMVLPLWESRSHLGMIFRNAMACKAVRPKTTTTAEKEPASKDVLGH